jgi:NADH:ubiquinone oxidoreductase subunit K
MKESAIAIAIMLAILIAIQFGPMVPKSHGIQPKLRTRRLPFRFSLLTPLIAATVVAVGLGLFVIMLRGKLSADALPM